VEPSVIKEQQPMKIGIIPGASKETKKNVDMPLV
jgi:hypothetical protein